MSNFVTKQLEYISAASIDWFEYDTQSTRFRFRLFYIVEDEFDVTIDQNGHPCDTIVD